MVIHSTSVPPYEWILRHDEPDSNYTINLASPMSHVAFYKSDQLLTRLVSDVSSTRSPVFAMRHCLRILCIDGYSCLYQHHLAFWNTVLFPPFLSNVVVLSGLFDLWPFLSSSVSQGFVLAHSLFCCCAIRSNKSGKSCHAWQCIVRVTTITYLRVRC